MQVRILTIAGLDPCAGAGMTADVRLVHQKGGDVAAVPTCLTVQNRKAFLRAEPVPESWLHDALGAVFDDGPVHAIKVGMVADAATAAAVAGALAGRGLPVVVDPVLSATVGGYDPDGAVAGAIREHLLPAADIATPNAKELTALGAVAELVQSCAILETGGDGASDEVVDRLHVVGEDVHEFANPRLPRSTPIHGTGCALSTLIAFYLGGGAPLPIACEAAIQDVRRCIAATPEADGGGAAPLRVV